MDGRTPFTGLKEKKGVSTLSRYFKIARGLSLYGRTPFTWLPDDDATGCPDQGHNHHRQQTEKERKTTRKKKERSVQWGERREKRRK